MHHAVAILIWAVSLAVIEIIGRSKGLTSWRNLSQKINSPIPPEQRVPHRIMGVCFPCIVAVLIWSIAFTRWYYALLYPAAGLVLSIFIQEKIDPVSLVKYGWPAPVIGSLYLWVGILVQRL